MSRSIIHFRIFYTLLAAAIITLPFSIFFQLPILLLLLLNWIAEWNWKNKFYAVKSNGLTKCFLAFIGLYVIYLLGLIHTSNFKYAFSDLECKLFLFFIPFILLSSDKTIFTRNKAEKLLILFIFSAAAMVLANLLLSSYNYLSTNNIHNFFYKKLSHFSHPTYSAMYVNTAFLLILHFLYITRIKSKGIKVIFYSLLPIFALYILLLQSKAGLMISVISIALYGMYLLNHQKKQWKISLALLLLGIGVFVAVSQYTPLLDRMLAATEAIKTSKEIKNPKDGTVVRLSAWETAWEIGRDQFIIGIGTGDVKDALVKKYEEKGYVYMAEQRFNAHCQYLQTFVALGLIGVIALVLMLIAPLLAVPTRREIFLIVFVLVVFCHLLVESMLEVRAGCDFIAIFSNLLCYYFAIEDESEKPKLDLSGKK